MSHPCGFCKPEVATKMCDRNPRGGGGGTWDFSEGDDRMGDKNQDAITVSNKTPKNPMPNF